MNTKDKKPKKVSLDYGEGSIYFIGSRNRYAGQIYVTIDGEKERRTVYGKTERIVKDKLRELQIQAKAGNLVSRKKKKSEILTIYQLADKMIEDQFSINELRQSSYERKKGTLKMVEEISGMLLTDVTEDHLIDFFKNRLSYSQSSINKMYQLLNSVFIKATKRGIIEANPMRDFKCPKSRQKHIPVRALTVEEQQQLLDILKSEDVRYSEIMLIAMFTGMRIGEVCALSVEDISLTDRTIRISKTVSRGEYGTTAINEAKTEAGMRTLYVNEEVADFLKECIGDKSEGLLFLSSNNKLVTTNQVNYSYASVMKKFNVVDESVYGKVDLHSLRHTYATRCIESGMPAKVLQKILGHTDINITLNTYCDVFEKYRSEHLAIADDYMRANNLKIA